VHRLDAGAVDLGHVRRVDERQRDHAVRRDRPVRDVAELQARQPEADEERDNDDRRSAEEVGIGDRQGPQRSRCGPRQTADDRNAERQHQDEHLRDPHHPQVQLEARPDIGHRQRVAVRIEERVDYLMERVHRVVTSGR
jgi:hypothetical protein